MKQFCLVALSILLVSCSSVPKGPFIEKSDNHQVDYSNLDNWAASPLKQDLGDSTPGNLFQDKQKEAKVDVFFIHPTTYTKQKGNTKWNGAIDDKQLNKKTDEGSIQFQASVFNGAAKIYAPRYRQAHIQVFFNTDEDKKPYGEKAMALAYKDVKAAFEYYLKHHNNGRPIIIAGHSQGTLHAGTLIKDFFEDQELMDQLVAAYLVGMPVRTNTFNALDVCKDANETGCFLSWRSYQRGFLPKWHEPNSNIVVTNPLNWKTNNEYAPKELNKGTLLFNFEEGLTPGIADAQIYEDHLWVNKPKFKGSIFVRFKNYHIADYNLFYANIRENVINRVEQFLEKQ